MCIGTIRAMGLTNVHVHHVRRGDRVAARGDGVMLGEEIFTDGSLMGGILARAGWVRAGREQVGAYETVGFV